MVPRVGVEPTRPIQALDFKSNASTYSAIQALPIKSGVP